MKLLIVATEYAIGMLPFGSNLYNILSQCDNIEVYGIFLSKGNRDYKQLIATQFHDKAIFLENDYGKIHNLINKFLPIKLYRTIRATADKYNIENIHFVTGDFSMGYLLSLLRKKYNIFYTAHDIMPHAYGNISIKDKIFNKLIRRGTLQMLHKAHHVTTCSTKQIAQISQIHNISAQFTPFPSLVSESMKNDKDVCAETKDIGKYILFFGGITHYKGVELLYDAFTQSPQLYNNYKLVITGRGSINREKHPNVIHIARFIKDSEMHDLFTNAACIVYPYLSATMSGVLSVAYYYGTPMVLSDIDFFKENASQAAHLFATGNSQSLQNALLEVLSNSPEQIEKEIAINKKYYQEIYSNDAVARRYEQFYQDALNKHIVIIRSSGNVIDYNAYNCQEIGLGKALCKQGYRVSVVMAGNTAQHHNIQVTDSNSIDVYHLKCNSINQALSHFVGFEKLLNTLKADIIQVHDLGQWMTYLTTCYAHKHRIPSVLIQGTYQETQKPFFKQLEILYNNTIGLLTLKKIGCIGCKTDKSAEYIRRYTSKATYPTRIGLDIERLKTTTEVSTDLIKKLNGKKVLLYVGTLEKRRNPLFLIDLIGTLPNDYVLVVVGGGPLEQECRNKAQKAAPDKCIFMGRQPQKAMPAIYNLAHLFLLPTDYEIYGMVILEAMYFGVPVITTANAGSMTIIDNNKDGIIIPKLDIALWQNSIKDICQNTPLWLNMKNEAHNKIKSQYLWDSNIVQQYIKTYSIAEQNIAQQ